MSSFELYQYFPSEVRMVVIDEMEPADRCRFTRTSRMCYKEAKASKNYMFSLEYRERSQCLLHIAVSFGEQEHYMNPHGFCLTFMQYGGKKYMEYRKEMIRTYFYSNKPLWKIELDYSIDLVQFATRHFTHLAHVYQNSIKRLLMHTEDSGNLNLGLERLGNLKQLMVSRQVDISQFLEKIQRPLHMLITSGVTNSQIVAKWQPISQTRLKLKLPSLRLNSQEFGQLSAPYFEIHIGKLTEMDIYNHIRSWQDGTKQDVYYEHKWHLYGSTFCLKTLESLLGASNHNWREARLKIKHDKDNTRTAFISCRQGDPSLFFEADREKKPYSICMLL